MDQLPELALIALFDCLPVFDQLKIRSVCKQWKAITEKRLLSRKELVSFNKAAVRPLIWFHSDRPVNPFSSAAVNEKFLKSRFLKSQTFKSLLKNVERLYLICRLKDLRKSRFINFVNEYPRLKHLQVETLADPLSGVGKLKIELNLPNLKSFCLDTIGDTELLRLNCPELEKLSAPYHFVADEKCSFRESLKFLKVASFQCQPGFELPNLEVLFCQNVLPIDIASHTKLKEIHYFNWHWGLGHPILIDSQTPWDRNVVLEGLFQQRRLLNRSDLQVYSGGLKCSPENPIVFRMVTDRFQPSDLILISENSENLKLEHQRKELLYEVRSNGFDEFNEKVDRISAEKAEKLAKCLMKVVMVENFTQEISLNSKFKILFKYVQELWLWQEFRTQRDLDRLPDLFPHIVELNQRTFFPSRYQNDLTDGRLNFCFLASFKALQIFRTEDWNVSPSELEEMLKNCRYLQELRIYPAKLEQPVYERIRTRLNEVKLTN